ncbi:MULTISPECIES: hypothetical protein [unclassified Methylophaga]|uniref:hypothetical protein n=1 Tax=unclassified Methylophaga TaxID=2629249 RepID=UPI000C911C4D|nr:MULTISPECIES: hypothetical protein [unclassified Methylophaga]MBN46338.1 hypothetical protein [Methylophaga sp.]|tara:strand:+ start:70262 stop:70519 length:258 start_codon:yes stop_codon:yes gene_type:complete
MKCFYYLVREGVYDQGIFWIGQDFQEGKNMADNFATNDSDDYHSWNLRKFIQIDHSISIEFRNDGFRNYDQASAYEVVYTGTRQI